VIKLCFNSVYFEAGVSDEDIASVFIVDKPNKKLSRNMLQSGQYSCEIFRPVNCNALQLVGRFGTVQSFRETSPLHAIIFK
jgi:hypothetical protein